jgi:hypothetical protein
MALDQTELAVGLGRKAEAERSYRNGNCSLIQ